MSKKIEPILTGASIADLLKTDKLSGPLFKELNEILGQTLSDSARIHIARILDTTRDYSEIEYSIQYNANVGHPADRLHSKLYSSRYIGDLTLRGYPSGMYIRFQEATPERPAKEEPAVKDEVPVSMVKHTPNENHCTGFVKMEGYQSILMEDRKVHYFKAKDVSDFSLTGNNITVRTVTEGYRPTLIAVFYKTNRSASIAMSKLISALNLATS